MKKLALLFSMIFMIISVSAEKLDKLAGTITKDGKEYVLKTDDKTYKFDKKLKAKAKKLVDKEVTLKKVELKDDTIKKASKMEAASSDEEADDSDKKKKKKKKKK